MEQNKEYIHFIDDDPKGCWYVGKMIVLCGIGAALLIILISEISKLC